MFALLFVVLVISFGKGCGGGSPAKINRLKTRSTIHSMAGFQSTLHCHYSGQPMPEAIWMKNGVVLKDCNRCVTKVDNATPGMSKLHVTPYRDDDFGEYLCKARNKNGFANIVIHLVEEQSDKSQCEKDVIAGKDPRLNLEYRPRCNDDGSYHRVQCSIHLQTCWCVDRQTGHKVADVYKGQHGYHCTPPRDISMGSIVTVTFGIILLIVITDVAAYAFCNRGILHCIVSYKKKRFMYDKLRSKNRKDDNISEKGQQ